MYTEQDRAKMDEMLQSGASVEEVAEAFNVHRTTLEKRLALQGYVIRVYRRLEVNRDAIKAAAVALETAPV